MEKSKERSLTFSEKALRLALLSYVWVTLEIILVDRLLGSIWLLITLIIMASVASQQGE